MPSGSDSEFVGFMSEYLSDAKRQIFEYKSSKQREFQTGGRGMSLAQKGEGPPLHPDDPNFTAPAGKKKIDVVFNFAKITNPDINIGNKYKVRDLGGNTLGLVKIPGGFSNMILDDRFLGELGMKDMVLLLDTVIHEGLHRTYSIPENMRMGFEHPEIYAEANRYTDKLRESFEGHIRSVYQ